LATGVGRFGYLQETVIKFEIKSGIAENASFSHTKRYRRRDKTSLVDTGMSVFHQFFVKTGKPFQLKLNPYSGLLCGSRHLVCSAIAGNTHCVIKPMQKKGASFRGPWWIFHGYIQAPWL
jgi:hypothetical protein